MSTAFYILTMHLCVLFLSAWPLGAILNVVTLD